MSKDLIWRIVPIAGAVVLVLGVVAMLCYSGREVSIESVIALIVAAAGALGLGAASLRGGSGNGSGMAGGLIILAASGLIAQGCTPAQRCLAERSTVAALGLAVDLAEPHVAGMEHGGEALEIARSSIAAGDLLVSACETLRDGSEWQDWLALAVAAVKAVLRIVSAAGVNLPADVATRLDSLGV